MSRRAEYFRELRPTLALALPIVVGNVGQTLMGVTDSVMIGHAGTVPLAASAFASAVFNLFFVVGVGLMLPTAIFVARARGAGQLREAAEYLRHGVAAAAVCGAVGTLALGLVATQLDRFDQPPEVTAIVLPYFLLTAASLGPVLAYLVLREFAEAMGHPWAPMFILLGGVALNAGLNWVLIYGNLGMPALGLTGAGIATLLSRLASLAGLYGWLRRDRSVRAAWPGRGGGAGVPAWWGGYSRARFREALQIGLPAAGMLLFEVTAFAFSGIMIGWLGAVPLAAHQIALSCASLAFMVPLGLGVANGMRVSHAVGAGERGRLRPIAFSTLGLGLAAMAAFAVAFAFGGRTIAGWYSADAAVVALAAQLLAVAAWFQLFDGTQVIMAGSLRAIADVRVPAAITLLAYWAAALPLGYFLGVRGPLGATGVWIGIAAGLTVAAVLLARRFSRLTRG